MALIDVKQYYEQVEKQYFEMLGDVKDLDEAFQNNIISEEQINQAHTMLDSVKSNYLRLSYIMLEFAKPRPRRKFRIKKFMKSNKDLYDNLKGHTKDDVLKENSDVLKNFKEYIKELKEKK